MLNIGLQYVDIHTLTSACCICSKQNAVFIRIADSLLSGTGASTVGT
jgi:hypothetical protein